MNLSDSEAAVSALSEFLLQKYENVKQAGAVFLEEEDFYADVKMVGILLMFVHQFPW